MVVIGFALWPLGEKVYKRDVIKGVRICQCYLVCPQLFLSHDRD